MKARANFSMTLRPTGLCLAIGLAGCSAIQLDVDVYKGPLASQEDVQLRQFATLAVAAKPLLADLRNAHEEFPNMSVQEKENWNNQPYTKPIARFVNGVLHFYGNRNASDGRPEVQAIRDARTTLNQDTKAFDVQKDKPDCEVGKRLESQKSVVPETSLTKLRTRYGNFMRGGEDEKSLCNLNNRRDTASVVNGARRVEDVASAWNELVELARQHKQGSSTAKVLAESQIGTSDSELISLLANSPKFEASVTGSYRQLATSKLAESVASVVYHGRGDASVLEDGSAKRMAEIGRRLLSARANLRVIWENAVELHKLSDVRGTPKEQAATSELLSLATEPRVLACYVDSYGGRSKYKNIVERLRDSRTGITEGWPVKGEGPRYRRANATVEEVAITYKAEFAHFLAEVDVDLRTRIGLDQRLSVQLKKCDPYKGEEVSADELVYSSSLYGLARGTAASNVLDERLADFNLELALPGGAYGFDSVRPAIGIEARAQLYIDAVDSGIRADIEVQQRQLEELLLLYAERLLYVVNNYHLLSKAEESQATIYPQGGHVGAQSKPSFARSTAVLEAMGNTLVVLVDDIKRQRSHKQGLIGSSLSEAVAINRAFSLNTSQTFDNIYQELYQTSLREGEHAAALTARSNQVTEKVVELRTQETTLNAEITSLTGVIAPLQTDAEAKKAAYQEARFAEMTIAPQAAHKNALQAVPDSGLAADRMAIAQVLSALGAKASQQSVRTAILSWLDGQVQAPATAANETRLVRLKGASAYFTKNPTLFSSQEITTTAAFNQVKAQVARSSSEAAQPAVKAADALKVAQQKKSDATTQLDDVKSKLVANGADGSAAQVAKLSTSVAERAEALAVIKDVKSKVVAKLGDAQGLEPKLVIHVLKEQLESQLELAKEADKKANGKSALAVERAIAYVASTNPIPTLSVTPSSPHALDAKTRKQVLDELIAQLNHQRLQAVSVGDTSRATNLEKALKVAYEQRAGMAYLRPASAYLRNVYAATSIKSEPDVGWVNLLKKAASRSLTPEPDKDGQIAVEKQFWERVNSIQMSAAGSSNYAIVKDDVGNWYVKAYGGDTGPIIASAQSLALFNMGKKFDVNLLRQVNLQTRLDAGGLSTDERESLESQLRTATASNQSSGASTAGLQTVQRKYSEGFVGQTRADATSLNDALNSLRADIIARWNSTLTGDKKGEIVTKLSTSIGDPADELKLAQTQLTEALAASDADASGAKVSASIVEALRSTNRLRARLVATISQNVEIVQAEQTKLDSQKSERATIVGTLAAAKNDRDIAQLKVNQFVSANTSLDDPAYTSARNDLELANKAVTSQEARLEAANKAVETASAEAELAVKNRQAASSAVNGVVGNLVLTFSERRLDAVKKLETAYSFIGEAATAK